MTIDLSSAILASLKHGPARRAWPRTHRKLQAGADPKPGAGEVFQGFSRFVDGFLFLLLVFVASLAANVVLGLIPCLGQILGPLASILDSDGDGQLGDDLARVGGGLLRRFFSRRR